MCLEWNDFAHTLQVTWIYCMELYIASTLNERHWKMNDDGDDQKHNGMPKYAIIRLHQQSKWAEIGPNKP